MLSRLPRSLDPQLLVGFESHDDAGVFRVSDTQALVQTMDFFTPVVDDPYAYGQIAAANALSDVYAMGGTPLTVMNIACFDPDMAPADVWARVLQGMADKTMEAGALVVGGHSVKDSEPKFGMSVTGIVDPEQMFVNSRAKVGDVVSLSKPLGTGIITTAAKNDACDHSTLKSAIDSMQSLNREAMEHGVRAEVRCATDITGFGLIGHLWNIAQASRVRIQVEVSRIPLLPDVKALAQGGQTTGGGAKNLAFLGENLIGAKNYSEDVADIVSDPQTSGGLAMFARHQVHDYPVIGRVIPGQPGIELVD
ncbi:MAG: selenide, water dikinase SelD [Fimbriimonadaceae bacterium]|nr:selenide, water dikinase SelD [Fimbriimonadaceae bacterium]